MFNDHDLLDDFMCWYSESCSSIETNPTVQELDKEAFKIEEKLNATFNDEQKTLMFDFENAFCAAQGAREDLIFRRGFRTGVQLVCAAFSKR